MTHLELTKGTKCISVFFLCFHGWDLRELIACGTVKAVEDYRKVVTHKCNITIGEGSKLLSRASHNRGTQ